MSPPTPISLALALLCIFLQNNQSFAFQPPNNAAYSVLSRGALAKLDVVATLQISKTHLPNEDDTEEFPQNELSRRDILQRSLCCIGAVFAASASGVDPVNAFPNFLLSADDNRGVKGMPVPSKKLGGLSNKIRGVSKIMVCHQCLPRS